MLLPESLAPISQSALESLGQSADLLKHWPESLLTQLDYVAGLSQFVVDVLNTDEHLLQVLPEMLQETSRHSAYRKRLAILLSDCHDEMSGHRVLRQFRNREMVYIAWRDFTGSWSLEESLEHLSQLAEAMIFETYQWQYKACCELWGTPCNAQGDAQPMLIIGMGKLGGGELNFSSDIDLIFTLTLTRITTKNTSHGIQFIAKQGEILLEFVVLSR